MYGASVSWYPHPRRGSRARTALIESIATAVVLGWMVGPAAAQQGLPPIAPGNATSEPAGNQRGPYAAILHSSEEAATLLSRAQQGIDRQDWKLAIDSLQRIIDLPADHVLTTDGRLYESARRRASRVILSLPPSGLSAYRLMYDVEAGSLLSKALAGHDLSLLRDVANRYLATRAGEQATAVLADWLIDEGRFAEAVAVLQSVAGIYPDPRLPQWLVPLRLSVSYAGLGRRERAEAELREAELSLNRPSSSQPASQPSWSAVSPSRLSSIRAYISRPPESPAASSASSWPLSYGRSSRDGLMPAVEPSFEDRWARHSRLGLSDGLENLETYAQVRNRLPVSGMVSDGRVLVVRSGPILRALDVETLETLWQSDVDDGELSSGITEESSNEPSWRLDGGRRGFLETMDNDAMVRRLYWDTAGSSLSIVNGMALTVQWRGEVPNIPRFDVNGPLLMMPGESGAGSNRIVSYSLADGRRLWESGQWPDDGKSLDVEYLSSPIEVGGQLVVPCRVNSDIYTAVLDAGDGRVLRSIYLCGTGGGVFDELGSLEPCMSDGVVYVPTGRGVLAALESWTWGVRWISRYDDGNRPGGWLPSPVIAVGDVVLVAGQGGDRLYCLDRASGEVRWRAARGDSRYLLGASDRRVWLGGESVRALDIEGGKDIWMRSAPEPTGRGVVAGDKLYLPTRSGLTALNATTSEPLDMPGFSGLKLGNLLAFNNALYSVDVDEVREFPDMQRGYQQAREEYEKNPSDAGKAIRLAHLELLRHSPGKALAAMEKLPADLKTGNPRRYALANHWTIASMLELANSGEVSAEQARKLLEEARRTAFSPEDAVAGALALGDYYRRENQPLAACLQYLSLALSRESERMISEDEEFQQRARSVAVRRLSDTAKGLNAEQKGKIDEVVRQALAGAKDKRDAEVMLWLAENPALGEAASEADLALGRWAEEDLRFEQAEGHFRRVLRRQPSSVLQAEASARLAAMYLLPEDLHLPVSALKLVDALERDFAVVEVPAGVLDAENVDSPPTSRPADDGQRISGAEAGRELRKRINEQVLARHRVAMSPVRLGTPHEPVPSLLRGGRPLITREPRIEPLVDKQLVLIDENKVEARRVEDGGVLWPAELKLLSELAVESRTDELGNAQRAYGPGLVGTAPARGLVDGQTLVLNSACGIHAIGLLTGRRLWSRRFDPPTTKPQERAGSDVWLWVHDGYVISIDRTGRLEVSRTTAGDRLLWSRKRAGRRWQAVRARGEYLVAVDERLETADIYRLDDGRYVGACQFKQDADHRVNILLFDDVICGPVSPRDVAAMALATPGVERWRVQVDDQPAQLFKPSADLLAVGDKNGGVQVIDPRTGERRMGPVAVKCCSDGVTDGVLSEGVLYVCGNRKVGTAGDQLQQTRGLAAIRVQDGAVLWEKGELGAGTYLNQEVLECAANAIPVVILESNDPSGPTRSTVRGSQIRISVLDKASGRRIGEPLEVPLEADLGGTRIASLEVHPGQMQVTGGGIQLRFPFDPPGEAGGSPSSRPAASRPEDKTTAGGDTDKQSEGWSE